MVEWEEESQALQTKVIKKVIMSDKKVDQLNAIRPKFWDSISASTYSKKVALQFRAC